MSHENLIERLRDESEDADEDGRLSAAKLLRRVADALAECDRELLAAAATADNCEVLRAELAALRYWKQSQLAVEAEWNEQAVAKLLGIRIGSPIRPAIEPAVKCLIAERDALRADIDSAKEALAALRAQEPVAWMRMWAINGEKPEKTRNKNGRLCWPLKFKLLPVTKEKCLPDDCPLYAAPVPATVPAEPVGDERAAFERWYAENAFDYASSPVGSRDCGLQWKAWIAHSKLPATVRQPLTDEQRTALLIELSVNNTAGTTSEMFGLIVRAVERAHGIGEHHE